jgi:two-component system, chemotaxis family, protein-glutamate methylesterase/glutaminase
MASHEPAPPGGSYRPAHLVVIGCSAGGLLALTRVLAPLRADLSAAIIVVQHLSPQFKSNLADILGRRTELHVHEAESGTVIEPGHVYIAPPDMHVTLNQYGRIKLDQTARVNFTRPSVDRLFVSAASMFGERVIAVVLSGSGTDGAKGAAVVHEHAGVVIAQDEASSEHFSMPGAAIHRGIVDYVLPVDAIAAQLLMLTSNQ